jgi:hypothetical protein
MESVTFFFSLAGFPLARTASDAGIGAQGPTAILFFFALLGVENKDDPLRVVNNKVSSGPR